MSLATSGRQVHVFIYVFRYLVQKLIYMLFGKIPMEEVIQEHTVSHGRVFFILICIAVLVLGGLAFYLFVLASPFVEKPMLEKPMLLTDIAAANGELISQSLASTTVAIFDETHLRFLLTEAGVYRLHANPVTGDIPEIELRFTDLSKVYAVTVEDNVVNVREGSASHPDIRVELDQNVVVELITAETHEERAKRALDMLNRGAYTAKIITTEKDLLFKGYLGLYQELQGMAATGNLVGDAGLPMLGAKFFLSYFGALLITLLLLVISLHEEE